MAMKIMQLKFGNVHCFCYVATEKNLMKQMSSDDIIARLVKSHPSLKSQLLYSSPFSQ